MINQAQRYTSFKSFYPFYLSQHQNSACRALHYIGSVLVIAVLVVSMVLEMYKMLFFMPVIGYGFAWVGHFVFEKNRPATFQYPVYSLVADWVMLAQWGVSLLKRTNIKN